MNVYDSKKILHEWKTVDQKRLLQILTTFDAVPPGQQLKRIRPADKVEDKPNALLMKTPSKGMSTYCEAHPNSNCVHTHTHTHTHTYISIQKSDESVVILLHSSHPKTVHFSNYPLNPNITPQLITITHLTITLHKN